MNPVIKKRLKILLIAALVVLSADLGTKYWARHVLAKRSIQGDGHQMVVIPGFWSFIYTENRNIGFSIFSSLDGKMSPMAKRIMIILLQCAACLVFTFIYLTAKNDIYNIPSAGIICGALGNILDRVFRGYVIDFVRLDFPFTFPVLGTNTWPIFNIADSTVVVSAVSIIILYIIYERKAPHAEQRQIR